MYIYVCVYLSIYLYILVLSKLKPSLFPLPDFFSYGLLVCGSRVLHSDPIFLLEARGDSMLHVVPWPGTGPCLAASPILTPCCLQQLAQDLSLDCHTCRASQPLTYPGFCSPILSAQDTSSSLFATLYFPTLLKALLFQEICRPPKEQLPFFIP